MFAFLPPLLHFTFFLTHPAWGIPSPPTLQPSSQNEPHLSQISFVSGQTLFSRGKWDETFSATFEGNGVRLISLSFFDCYGQNFVFLQFSPPHPTSLISEILAVASFGHHHLEASDCISLYVYTMVTFTRL